MSVKFKMVDKPKSYTNSFFNKPPFFFLIVALISLILFIYLDKNDSEYGYHDILVEAHGIFFDLIVFGILLSLYEGFRSKKERIDQLNDEIDDYRMWNEKEAMYRNVGNIKRLLKEGKHKLDLKFSYLEGARLEYLDLSRSSFWGANLNRAIFTRSNMSYSFFISSTCINTCFYQTDISNSMLSYVDFTKADLSEANLSNSDLTKANLTEANLTKANLSNTDLSNSDLTKANLIGVKWINSDLTQVILEKAIVERDWFKIIKTSKVNGIEEVITRYTIKKDIDNYLLIQI